MIYKVSNKQFIDVKCNIQVVSEIGPQTSGVGLLHKNRQRTSYEHVS